MDEEQRNESKDSLRSGLSSAYAVQGAVKTGKAVSRAAKGAAAFGPYGMLAGGIWENRNQLGKLLAAVIALLMIPVLFLSLLPGLIFDGFGKAFSPADPDAPILNSETAIVENANTITFAINAILGEGLEDVFARIDADFSASGGDQMEVTNPYENGTVCNINLFISQYCAARDRDFASIAISDMESIMRSNKQHLYSYSRREELKEVPGKDPETGEDITITEKWIYYTIIYNGEAYFADQVFSLSDEQKGLADNYAENLSLFLGDGLIQNLAGATDKGIPSLGDVCFSDGITNVVYFNQLDERYAGKPYGTDNIGGYGCGPTSMSIVVSSLAGTIVDPVEMARWSYENGYWCKNSGSYHSLIPAAAANWGLPVSGCSVSEPQRILDALSSGKLVVAIMSKGHFTKSGHFIVLRGIKDGKVLVADPASYKRSEQLWDLSLIINEASRRAGAGGPFWIIG